MAQYNTKTVKRATTKMVNHQGGNSYKISPKLELISILAAGFGNTYYEKLTDREIRFKDLVNEISKTDAEFVAKAMVYARSVIGQRTATHFGAVALTPSLSGMELGKRFFSKRNRKVNKGGIIYRLDDMLEIVACYQHFNPGKPLPASMKKGFKLALEKADTYELAKYQGKGKSVSLVDVVNLVHPHPTAEMTETFKALMSGDLKQFNTVEDKNTSAGQEVAKKVKEGKITKAEAEVELTQSKKENFAELVDTKKIGYLALLRNLRNIIINDASADMIGKVSNLLTDETFIRKSLVFPHQIDIAMEVLVTDKVKVPTKLLQALNSAYELSIPNLAELFPSGKTAVVIDTSGSMFGGYSGMKMNGKSINKSPIQKAALIGATLAKGIDADFFQFGRTCEKINYNPIDSYNTIKKYALSQEGRVGHDTRFNEIFKTLNSGGYDRIFIVSDLQGGDTIIGNSEYSNYVTTNGKPMIYTIDLCGYGSTMFKQDKNLVQLFGYGSDIYEMAKKVEIDPKALLKEIEAIEI